MTIRFSADDVPRSAGPREKRTTFATGKSMFRRLLLLAMIAATGLPGTACDASEAAPILPQPARRDAGLADAGTVDATPPVDAPTDAGVAVDAGLRRDAGLPDAGVRRRRPPRIDAGVPDAGLTDGGLADAPVMDAPTTDAAAPDAGPGDARVLDPPIDARPPTDARDILRDSGEAPPLYDARILSE
jgi:hypothetical protein